MDSPFVFISYAHVDGNMVLPIIKSMKKNGINVWYDEGILAGSEWPEYVAQKVISCTKFVCFISKAYLTSGNCKRELNLAVSRGKELLSVHLKEVELSPGVEMQLGTYQAVFRNRFPTYDMFVSSLCKEPFFEPCISKELLAQTHNKATIASVPNKTKGKQIVLLDFLKRVGRKAKNANSESNIINVNDYIFGLGSDFPKLCYSSFHDFRKYAYVNADIISRLGTIRLPDSVGLLYLDKMAIIPENAFVDCKGLEIVCISSNVAIIEKGAFSGCDYLKLVIFIDENKQRKIKDLDFLFDHIIYCSVKDSTLRNLYHFCRCYDFGNETQEKADMRRLSEWCKNTLSKYS